MDEELKEKMLKLGECYYTGRHYYAGRVQFMNEIDRNIIAKRTVGNRS